MNARSVLPVVVLALCLLGDAAAARRSVTDTDAPRALPLRGPVSVSWDDPARFAELRYSHNRREAARGDWVARLATHLRTRAERRLPAGERLEVHLLDVERAGEYEPWHGMSYHDVRIYREVYPPRLRLSFRRFATDGSLLAEGERALADLAFLSQTPVANSGDPLRYEKRLIDRWLLKEFPAASR